MGLFDSLKGKMSSASKSMQYSSGSAEDAINHISYQIARNVEAGNFDSAKSTLRSNLDELMSGEMETESFRGQGNPKKTWDKPEKEAQHFVNEAYLYLLEMAVKDLEGIDNHLEPPIRTKWFRWENGIKQRIEDIHELHAKVEKAYPDEVTKKEIDANTSEWYIEQYYYAQHWNDERPSYNSLDDGVLAKVTEWKWISRSESKAAREIREVLGTDQEQDHNSNGDDKILQKVVRARRRIEFIEKLANWEEENYQLQIDRQELQKIEEVKNWVKEREQAIKELDGCLEPITVRYDNPEEVEGNIAEAENILKRLRGHEGAEDKKLKKLEEELP